MTKQLLPLIGCLLISACGNFSERMTERVNDTGGWVSEQLSGSGKAKDPAELVEFEPLFKPEKIWSKSLSDGAGRGFPKPEPGYFADQITVVSDRRRSLVSWDHQTRKRLWRVGFDQKIGAGVGVNDQYILVVNRDAELLALSRETGELVWQTQMPSEVIAPPVANSEVIVVSTSDGKLLGLQATDGQQKWMIDREVPALSLRGGSAPLLMGDTVIKGFADGRLLAVNLNNGFDEWETPVGQSRGRSELSRMVDADATPVADNGTVYASAYQGRVVAIGQNSGEVLWSRTLSSYSNLAIDLFNVYLTDDEDTVWALDRRTGATYWKQEALAARRISGPAVIGDYLVVADFDGYLHWMSRDDGSFVARSRPAKTTVSAPLTVINDQLYVFSDDGRLTILAPPGLTTADPSESGT